MLVVELEQKLKTTVADAIIQFSRTLDTEYFCDIYEFKLMLEDGADNRKLNQTTMEGTFAHQAVYKGLTFISITKQKISVLKNYHPELD